MSKPARAAPILGLDLGSSTCEACVIHQGEPRFIRPDLVYLPPGSDPNLRGYQSVVMPSAFSHHDGDPKVGHRALNDLSDPHFAPGIVQEVKRWMHLDGSFPITLGDQTYQPSEITGQYVNVLRLAAEMELGLPPQAIQEAVVTLPTHFGAAAQLATKRACEFAGLKARFIDEPVAAAYSLGLQDLPGRQSVLVVDLGGGTFDVTLLRVGREAGHHGFEELGRDGHYRLGGLDWDREIADWALREALPTAPLDLRERLMNDPRDLGHKRLFRACEEAKLIFFEGLERNGLADPSRPLDPRLLPRLRVQFTLEPGGRPLSAVMPGPAFLKKTEPLVEKCARVCERLFHDVKSLERLDRFSWEDLDCIYLAGGGSQMATVQRRFAEKWGRPPKLDDNPQHAVAKGAALCAHAIREGRDLIGVLGRVRYPHTIGVMAGRDDGQPEVFCPLIQRNTALPFRKTFTFLPDGDLTLTTLRIKLAEEAFDPAEGVRRQEISTVEVPNLPSAAPGVQELVEITAECDQNSALTFRIAFRARDLPVAVNAGQQRPGSPPVPDSRRAGAGGAGIPPS